MALFACNALGAIPSIINENSKANSLNKIQCSMNASFAFLDEGLLSLSCCFPDAKVMELGEITKVCSNYEVRENWQSPCISTDPALLIYTSGSTGAPKGIALSQESVLFASEKIQERIVYNNSDVVGLFLPLSFDYGLYQVFLTALSGATLKIFDASYSGPALISTLQKYKITVLPGVPHLYSILIKFLSRRSQVLNDIRVCTNTGANLSINNIELLRSVLPNALIFPMYGLTECKRVSILKPEEIESHPNSVGRPLNDTEVFVVDDNGIPLPPDSVGELVVCGKHLALGYWCAEKETALRFKKHPLGIGRALFTGDDFRMDKDGFLYYIGRRDEQIKRKGFRIHC